MKHSIDMCGMLRSSVILAMIVLATWSCSHGRSVGCFDRGYRTEGMIRETCVFTLNWSPGLVDSLIIINLYKLFRGIIESFPFQYKEGGCGWLP